jgi:predicted DNA-binding protein (MmcQ/YjbR family)
MPATAAARPKQIRTFALSLPGTQPKSPWPGHDDVAVNNKTFVYLGLRDEEVSVGVKLPVSRATVLALPKTTPMAYGLGKSGWVSIRFEPSAGPTLDTIKHWVMESYRAQAPKRVLRQLEAEQPWVAAGALPR